MCTSTVALSGLIARVWRKSIPIQAVESPSPSPPIVAWLLRFSVVIPGGQAAQG